MEDFVYKLNNFNSLSNSLQNTADFLEMMWHNEIVTYPHNVSHMQYKDFAMVLPFETLCTSMAVSDKSALSVHFRHNAGLTLRQLDTLKDWLDSYYTVSVRHYQPKQECTVVERLSLMKQIGEFIVWLRFLTEAKISAKDMAPFYFMQGGRILPATEWLPMVAKRRQELLSEESNSRYSEFLNRGYTTFQTSSRGCIAEFRDWEYVRKMMETRPEYFALDIRRKIRLHEIPLPPYDLVKDLNDKDWESLYGADFTSVKTAIMSRRRQEYALSPVENMRLGLIVANGINIRDEEYSIQELLIKLTEGTYLDDVKRELDEYNENLDRHRRAAQHAKVIHDLVRNGTNATLTRDPLKHLQDVLLERIHEETGMNVTEEELHEWIQDTDDNPVRRSLVPFGIDYGNDVTGNNTSPPLVRKKRFIQAIVSLTMRVVPQMQKVFGLLYKATRHWFNKIIGNPITTRTLAISQKTIMKADSAGQMAKKKIATFVTRARNSRQKRALMEKFGPFAQESLQFVKDVGNRMSISKKAIFTPSRAGHLRMPTTLPTRFQDLNGNKAVMHLRNRMFRSWQYAKNHKLSTTFNIAGVALLGYGISDLVASSAEDQKIDFCEGAGPSNYNCTEDTLATRPLLRAAISNYNGILKPAFLYNVYKDSNISIADQLQNLQREVLGQLGHVNVTDDYRDVVKTSLDHLEDAYREGNTVNIFDQEVSLKERQRHLKAMRNSNAVTRYHTSYEFAHLLYGQKSTIHKQALERFELFVGLQSYSHRTLQADEQFQDELIRGYCLGTIGKQAFIAEVDAYFYLTYNQLREQYQQFIKRGHDIGAPSSLDSLEGQSPQLDLIGLGSDDHHIFKALTMRRGQEELNAQDKDMDLILALDDERRHWGDNYQTHRLLIRELSFDMPPDPVQSDYIHSVMWYQIYLARPNIRKQVEYFMIKTSKLLLVRLYIENRAVNMSTAALEEQMDEIDLEELRENNDEYVIDTTSLREAIDNTEHYDILRDPNEAITDFSATPEQIEENPEIIKLTFGSQVNDKLNDNSTDTTGKQLLRRIKRSATHIFETLTNTTLYQQDVARMISDQDHLDLLVARHRLHLEQGNLTMHNLLLLQEELKRMRNVEDEYSTVEEVQKAHQLYLVNVIKYLSKEEYPDLGILSMILTPEQVERVGAERKDIGEKLMSTQLVGRLQPIGDLQQKNAILAYLQTQQDNRIENERKAQLKENEMRAFDKIMDEEKLYEETFEIERERLRRETNEMIAELRGLKDYSKLDLYDHHLCGTSKLSEDARRNWQTWRLSLITSGMCWINAPAYQLKALCFMVVVTAGVLFVLFLMTVVVSVMVEGAMEMVSSPTNENNNNTHGRNEDAQEERPCLLNPDED